MPQITLLIPREKIPILHEFLEDNGIENNYISQLFANTRKNSTTSIAATDLSEELIGWEYFCNELEFE